MLGMVTEIMSTACHGQNYKPHHQLAGVNLLITSECAIPAELESIGSFIKGKVRQ